MRMDRILKKAFLIFCYLYFAIVISFSITNDYRVFIISFILFFSFEIFFVKKMQKEIESKEIYETIGNKFFDHNTKNKKTTNYLIIIFVIILCGQLVFWLGYFPGGFNLDAYGQWMQAHNDLALNDWHPFVSTLIIKLIVKICDSFAFYIFCGLLLYTMSASLVVYELSQHGLRNIWISVLTLFYSISPAISLQNICLTKDVQFTILFNFLFLLLLKVSFSKGKWLTRKKNAIFLSILCTLLIFVRHNGVLFVATLFFMMAILYKKEREIILEMIAVVLCFSFIIKVPVSRALRVEPHDNVIGEAIGIPMSIMANAIVNDNNIPKDVHDFLNEIADDNEWENHYIVGEWDSCKWKFGGTELLKGISLQEILYYTMKTTISCPMATYQSLKANTRITWETFDSLEDWIPYVYIEENKYGINEKEVPVFRTLSSGILYCSQILPISLPIWNIGFQCIMILLAYVLFTEKVDKHILLLIMPLLLFNIGTTLLLAGPNYRYFYHTGIVFIPIFFLLFYYDKSKEK